MPRNNRVRSLADVVSLQAWHEGFSAKRRKADLHVDVVFQAGRLGGGPGDEVRFKLGLKSAEVVVIIPPVEPLKIETTSVTRDAPQQTVRVREVAKKAKKVKTKIGASVGLGLSGPRASLGGEVQGELEGSQEQVKAVIQQLQGMTIMHSQTADGDHRWTITPNAGETLAGRPWEAAKEPRLKVVDQRANRDDLLSPTVRVEVRCRREDLEITDIHLTDEGMLSVIKLGGNHRNRIAAAEALIRTRLFEEGLVSGNMSDPYALMVLADVQAESV